MIKWVQTKSITRPASKVCPKKIAKHITAIENDMEPMPVDVALMANGMYTVCGNGRHRLIAYVTIGISCIPVRVINS